MASASPGRDTPVAGTIPEATDGTESGRITNAPALPAAPRYAGSTMRDRRDFMRAYETYFHALSAFDTGFGRPFIVLVSGCIGERTCKMTCLYEFQKRPNHVSESEWVAYFLQARESGLEDYTTVDAAMKYLKMWTTFPDAASRMGQLRADMHRILDEHTVEQLMMEKEQKKVVKYFIAALEPADFREAIQKRPEYTQHKALKSDIVKCYTWIGSSTGTSASKNTSYSARKSAPKSQNGALPRRSCLKCGSLARLVRQCPGITSVQVVRLLAARKAMVVSESNTGVKHVQVVPEGGAGTVPVRVTPATRAVGSDSSMIDDGNAQATIDGYMLQATLLDSGADDSVVSGGIIRALESAVVTIREYSVSRTLDPFGRHLIPVTRKVQFGEVEIETSAGPLLLRNLECLVYEEDRTLSLTIGRPVTNCLGYTTDGLLAAARTRKSEYELLNTNEVTSDHSPLGRQQAMRTRTLETLDEDGDEQDELVTSPRLAIETTCAAQEALEVKIKEAIGNGIPNKEGKQLRDLLIRYVDVFRLSFGNDPPVRGPPLRVRLKEGARSVKAKARRYPPDHKRYVKEHIQELLDHGLVVENHRSRWSSAARIVEKRQAGQYQMIVDTRAVNALTETMPWPMPDIE
ncbi:Hypothetical protein PHPALM_4228 [Phytophthora palmivora]|uniref:Peptidase A2 domain-containing protein n=1 Tax=Phytophthora palmivora TaxID=4796 RepID=A0A2P4YKD0_9STRA|nr:Hypothetical protein PHPALM_4228 [Phytophthora palmivora]